MAVVSKASAAAKFETGDRPNQQDFADLIDSTVFIPAAGATGFIEIESTASATSRAVGAFGVIILGAATTASAQGHLGFSAIGTVGAEILSSQSTASAQGHIGAGTVGIQLLGAGTTASAQGHIGGGTVGIQILSAITTASAQGHVGLDKSLIQRVRTQTGAVATGTTLIPLDDTIPQNTEGDEYMTLAITPRSASSRLTIEAMAGHVSNSASGTFTIALFRDSTANALAAASETISGANHRVMLALTHDMASPGTTATTFKVRIGSDTAGTTTFNGSGGGRQHGGVVASSIVITEYMP